MNCQGVFQDVAQNYFKNNTCFQKDGEGIYLCTEIAGYILWTNNNQLSHSDIAAGQQDPNRAA